MEQGYRPTKKALIKESFNIIKNGISKSVKNDFVSYFTDVVLFNVKVYAIPTWIRREYEGKEKDYGSYVDDSWGKPLGLAFGIFGSVGIALAQVKAYLEIINNGHSEILYLPAITNGLSLIYEIGRGIYKNAQNKLIGKSNKIKNLETEVLNQ